MLIRPCPTSQPDSPAELGNKIYEMMAMALGGRWGRAEEAGGNSDSSKPTESDSTEGGGTAEAEVVEPSEVRAEGGPWSD